MSAQSTSHNDRLTVVAQQEGFAVADEDGMVRAIGVPCLLKGGKGECTIEKSYDPQTGLPTDTVGQAPHAVHITTTPGLGGVVYQASGQRMEAVIATDGDSWSNISIKVTRVAGNNEPETAREVVYRYVKQIVGAVKEVGEGPWAALEQESVFRIPNTHEERAEIRIIQDRIRAQRVGIIGLGGTGSYIFDLLSKIPVREIHLFDSDVVKGHNLFRAPGAPTAIEQPILLQERTFKVDYHFDKYDPLRKYIKVHHMRVDDVSAFCEHVAKYPLDFCFRVY